MPPTSVGGLLTFPMKLFTLSLLLGPLTLLAQFEPQVGVEGSTAIIGTSPLFVGWAKVCKATLGYQDISNPSLGLAAGGNEQSPLGKPGQNGVLTLGDGGSAVLTFEPPIANGEGADFAVFENGFQQSGTGLDFLEYAFVEVSSDGAHFVRFPAQYTGDTTTQIGPYEVTDTRKYHNLAGKYWSNYGTPFDLEELTGAEGLDISNITHVKIVDVVGSIDQRYASRDAQGHKINEPWPTDFPAGGFDLDAVGVLHQGVPNGIVENQGPSSIQLFPNPASEYVYIHTSGDPVNIRILNAAGQLLIERLQVVDQRIDVQNLDKGMYLLTLQTGQYVYTQQLLLQ